jgi:hypothetical protein
MTSTTFSFVVMDSNSAVTCSQLLVAVTSTKIMLDAAIMIKLGEDMIFLKIPMANLLLLGRRVTGSHRWN